MSPQRPTFGPPRRQRDPEDEEAERGSGALDLRPRRPDPQLPPDRPMFGIRSSLIIAVHMRSGEVVYFGSAADEG